MITRREFIRRSTVAGDAVALSGAGRFAPAAETTAVAVATSQDRAQAVGLAIDLLGVDPVRGDHVVLKPNFNSRDAFPGSTHTDILVALIDKLTALGARSFTVLDRSGIGATRQVFERKGIFDLTNDMAFEPVVIDEIPAADWAEFEVKDAHWRRGLFFPKLFLDAQNIVQTCCLKTHTFVGHFTMSLKNSVDMVAKVSPVDEYNFMDELHSSGHQRRMIAEINTLYSPDLVVMDAVDAFVSGGPAARKIASPGVMIAGTDRVAVDAVGGEILRSLGTTAAVSRGDVFE